jgi:cobalt/nickel transport protein
MKRVLASVLFVFAFLGVVSLTYAHFQEMIPSKDIVQMSDEKTIELELVFAHPMEDKAMSMEKPTKFGVLIGGEEKKDLMSSLKEIKIGEHKAYKAEVKITRPGDYVFYLEPAPYWEPAEEKMIIHYTKVVVNALGEEKGWDSEVGLPVEIVPLVRPYGLWTGNIFRAIVKQNGKPVPFAEVEVEYLNKGGKVKPPTDAHITQVIKADQNGVFCYAMPKEGWWGFSAILDGGKMKNPEGKEVEVEAGAVFWVHCQDMK